MNCAALPEHLIEDMLVGHEKGAFTGALKEHKGMFEQAHGGTVFLDEIGEMPIHLQAKLLRVLQEKKLNRLGGETPISLDVRVVAATNKDLKQAIQQREFREDLYFRISTFRLRIQPLAERPGDIVPLVLQSLARHAKEGVPYTLSTEARDMLAHYSWPGNVRELENVVQRAVVLCNGRTITPVHLMFDEGQSPDLQMMTAPAEALPVASAAVPEAPAQLPEPMEEAVQSAINLQHAVKSSEQQIIMAALQSTESREEAARKLGISPRTLRYKLAQLRNRGMSLSFAE
jgi:two-component system response regulator FlrC